jgi:glycosyltransferase involved in cell wall biosynthesis
MPNKTILIFSSYYLPGYKAGGPIRSISNLVEWLGNDFNFKVITIDRDIFETKSYNSIKVNSWNKVGKAEVYYIRKDDLNFKHIYKVLKETDYDVLYLNSLFNFWFSIIPLLVHKYLLKRISGKILLIPRGELSIGALGNKSIKKQLFIKLTSLLNFYKKINWQATNESEKQEIIDNYKIDSCNIRISSNLPTPFNARLNSTKAKIAGEIRIVYLSRITPKKNLNFFLKTLKEICDIKVNFDLYGVIDDEFYWKECEDTINSLPHNVNVNFKGSTKHEEVINVLSSYHLFVLPTKGENYGHAIYETIIAGTPPLISNKTPWKDINKENVGWSLPLKIQDFKVAVEHVGKMEFDEYNDLRESVIQYSKTLIPDKTIKDLNMIFTEIGKNLNER